MFNLKPTEIITDNIPSINPVSKKIASGGNSLKGSKSR